MAALNRVLATALALLLLLGGLLAVSEIVLAALDRPYWLVPYEQWSSWLSARRFSSGIVRTIAVGVIVLGVLLLVAAVRRGRPGALGLPGHTPGVQVTASRRGLEQALSRAVRGTDGVRSARVKAGRRRVKVTAATALRSPGGLQQQVSDAVDQHLEELGLAGTLRSRVTLSRRGAR